MPAVQMTSTRRARKGALALILGILWALAVCSLLLFAFGITGRLDAESDARVMAPPAANEASYSSGYADGKTAGLATVRAAWQAGLDEGALRCPAGSQR